NTFNEVVGMQFSIAWDDQLVYFNQLNINSVLPGLDASDFNAAAGQDFLSVVWFNPSLEAVSLPAGTELFELCFTTLDAEGIVPVQFVETPAYAEFIGDDGVLPMTLTDGQIDITVDGLVWPGDTDNNQLANHFDLLNIGLAYDATGAQRPNASTTWQAQAAPLWNLATPESAVDYRHVDTNGDGTINAQDTLALALNWGLESDNFLTGENGDGGATPLDGPPIFIQPDTIPAGATVALPIILGLPDDVIAAAYGLAFTVEYNPDLILPGSVHVTHDGWLGTPGTDLIGMYHDYYSQGRCEVALVRTNAMNVMGEGAVGHFIVTMEDVIFRDEVDVELPFRIVNPRLITYAEEEIPLTPRLTVTLVENLVNTRDLLLESAVSIWPNPTAERIQIRTDNLRLNQVTLLDMRGRILATFRNAPTQLDLSTYPAGLYQVHLQTEEGVVQKLVVKQ
ncbi:MAG: T9SS type A sorting domain-containing protein, partial [Lewinella sp.]|nr:T9SS type A sorting domain-containing protein [Lewinella sp.]